MFTDLEDLLKLLGISNAEYVLLDDTGEKVYANNLADEYYSLLMSNHLALALRKVSCAFQRCQLFFEQVHITVYLIDTCGLYFFNRRQVNGALLRKYDVVAERMNEIVRG